MAQTLIAGQSKAIAILVLVSVVRIDPPLRDKPRDDLGPKEDQAAARRRDDVPPYATEHCDGNESDYRAWRRDISPIDPSSSRLIVVGSGTLNV